MRHENAFDLRLNAFLDVYNYFNSLRTLNSKFGITKFIFYSGLSEKLSCCVLRCIDNCLKLKAQMSKDRKYPNTKYDTIILLKCCNYFYDVSRIF